MPKKDSYIHSPHFLPSYNTNTPSLRNWRWAFWISCELAIVATDLAEVIGSAIALKLLFGLPLPGGVAITAFDTLVILTGLQDKTRWLEVLVLVLLCIIFSCFVALLQRSDINAKDLFAGYLPSPQIVTNKDALYTSIGIIGATIMPHNLYLHSSSVIEHSQGKNKSASLKASIADLVVSLCLAFMVNSSILIVASSNFFYKGVEVGVVFGDFYFLFKICYDYDNNSDSEEER
jgi:manganese transport protein